MRVFRLLLHHKNEDGTVVRVGEGVDPANVMVLKDIGESRRGDDDALFGSVELRLTPIVFLTFRLIVGVSLSVLSFALVKLNKYTGSKVFSH